MKFTTNNMYILNCYVLVLWFREEYLKKKKSSYEIQPAHPKGNQSWIFTGRTDAEAETPILWPPDLVNLLIGKDPDAEKN